METTPIHGNYHGYYTKRPFDRDPRLVLLPQNLLKSARVLDVGCNEGFVTCEIGQVWGASKVVGVDIDDSLIRAAWKRRRMVWSQQAPNNLLEPRSPSPAITPERPTKRQRIPEVENGEEVSVFPGHFPASCEHMFGPLPISSSTSGMQTFPHNVLFRTADWVNFEISEDKLGYDIVIAFSLSKWIHLNEGDDGLTKFFRRVHAVLNPGGAFILEPQEWETYAKAKRMSAKLRDRAKQLKIRPEDFPDILEGLGFGPVQHLGVVGEGGFRRPVDLYKKAD